MRILITSASRKVLLVKAFQQALAIEGGGEVIAVDASPHAAALYAADECYLVPRGTGSEFLEAVLDICRRRSVKLVIPTRDEELLPFSESRERFAENGIFVAVADPESVKTCLDKWLFQQFCEDKGFPVPRAYGNNNAINFPVFLKERFGKGGAKTCKAASQAEFDRLVPFFQNPLVQEYIRAPEFTIDLFSDFSGRVISAVPRERIHVVAGESYVSRTVDCPPLIDLACKLAISLRLKGQNTIQCFYGEGGARLIEVNPRYGGASNLSIMAGANSPRYLVRIAQGKPVEPILGEYRRNLVMLRYAEDRILTHDQLLRPVHEN